MSARVHGFAVVLENTVSEENAVWIARLLGSINGVIVVEPIKQEPTPMHEQMITMRGIAHLRAALEEFERKELGQ